MTAMTGLLACIVRARATGIGGDVDTSLFDVALHQLGYAGTWYLNEGDETTRLARSSHFSASPVQTFTGGVSDNRSGRRQGSGSRKGNADDHPHGERA
jgi:crotonobetainyl-CoA:carnitine CoA-transferase CaiB-like acyl-CoA transferase